MEINSVMKVRSNGDKFWYDRKGNLHRSDGPAVEFTNGDKEWWIHGKRHREDGPAVIAGKHEYWFINDVIVLK